MMNKKGEERYLSPIMFLVWGFIAVSIFVGVLIIYSTKTDVRMEEAEFLGARVVNCLIEDGYLREDIEKGFDVFQECELSKKVIDSGDFYLYVGGLNQTIEEGDPDLKVQCGVKEDSEARYFAECFKTKIYASDKFDTSQRFLIEIITASNQKGREM